MKKKTLLAPMALALMAVASPVLANTESVPPLDAGIVVDVSGDSSSEQVDVNAMVTEQATEQATTTPTAPAAETQVQSNDGTDLPLDQSASEVGEIDSGQDVAPAAQTAEPEVVAPQEDTVVLTEKVEPLPQTGIEGNGMLYAALTVLLAGGLLVFMRAKKLVSN